MRTDVDGRMVKTKAFDTELDVTDFALHHTPPGPGWNDMFPLRSLISSPAMQLTGLRPPTLRRQWEMPETSVEARSEMPPVRRQRIKVHPRSLFPMLYFLLGRSLW